MMRTRHSARPSSTLFDEVLQVRVTLPDMADSENGDILVMVPDLVDDDVPLYNEPSDGGVAEAWMDRSQTRESSQAPRRFKNLTNERGPGASSTVLVLVSEVEQ